MAEDKIPYLSGCVLYLLLRKAALPDASPRQHKEGVKDDHKNPIFMSDLVYTFTGVQTVGSSTDTSNYREGKKEGREEERKNTEAALKRAEAAERRIIELEAQLAAVNGK